MDPEMSGEFGNYMFKIPNAMMKPLRYGDDKRVNNYNIIIYTL